MKKALSLILALVMLTGLLPQFTLPARAEETEAATNGLAGKTISILGDSISTYTGVSNNAAYNATLSGGAIYYTEGRWGVYQEDTWWQQAIDTLGLELTVNNSWSGSCIFNTRSGTVGAYVDRSVQLHNTQGEEPDMIAVYLGTNDFCNYKSTLGTSADIDYVSLITETEDGYTYATPTTAAEAYAIMLHKAAVRYPDSEIYCFTLLPQRISNTNVELLEQFNQTLLEIAEHFGAYGVDLYHDSGIKNDGNFATYVADNSLHPGPAGMDAITGCFISSILENSKYVAADVHSITYDLDNVIVDQGTAYAIMDGDTFSCTLTAPVGYDLSVTVTMGSTDITASSYANGKIRIPSVTADIAIAASAALPVKEAENYRWEFNGSDLSSVTTGNNTPNALTRLAGSITDGVHTHSRFQMSENVVLYHDRPWTIEWKSAGTWTDTTDGALLFAGATTSNTADTPYIYRRHKSDFIAIGVYTGGRYHNYGVALSTRGIDATIDHVYRMENRVAADSTNMVYLYVDGVEIGPMNHHWIGGTDQNETVDWVNGRDFVFSYMGTTPHTIGNCSINYIQVIECVHTHTYTTTVTAPTCTEQGYTTYTCDCGESYVDDYMDATGVHSYENGVCTTCGTAQPGPIITKQPTDSEATLGERYCVTVEANGEGLKYQWYFRNAGSDTWQESGIRDNTYDDVMTEARAGREIYCVITDANGNKVTTETAKLICLPSEELAIVTQPTDATAAFGEMFCATVEAKGEGLKYQWYFRNAGSDTWQKSGIRDNTYDFIMTKVRMNREVYCVITDMWGNTVTSDIVKLIAVPKTPLQLLGQTYESAAMDERFCVTVEAEGDGLTYTWYFRNAGSDKWEKSGVTDNTYDDVMTTARADREVYCVITDAFGNQVTTEVVTLELK